HLPRALPRPHQGDHRHVAHEVEHGAGGGAPAGRGAIGHSFPPFGQVVADLPFDQGIDQQGKQVHTAQSRHPRGSLPTACPPDPPAAGRPWAGGHSGGGGTGPRLSPPHTPPPARAAPWAAPDGGPRGGGGGRRGGGGQTPPPPPGGGGGRGPRPPPPPPTAPAT